MQTYNRKGILENEVAEQLKLPKGGSFSFSELRNWVILFQTNW